MNTDSMPKFSVITVTYNAEEVLERTIDSVVEQSYSQIEYIVIDGASTDNTSVILEKYRKVIDVLLCEPDEGLYDAMNKGISRATGDYVLFLNAGDTFYCPTTLEELLKTFPEERLPDVIYGNTALVDKKGDFVKMRRLKPPVELTWESFAKGMLVCHQAFFVKRELAEPYDLQYRYSSDFDWCIRILKKASFIHNSNLILVCYLDEGLTTKNRKASLKERFRIMVHYYGWPRTLLNHIGFVFRLLFQ
ncbi:MAG: glycosyltransferase [Bacteroidales bacterium]|nr:glycosyltransferase [Bacteroidales bacterium]